MADGGTQIEALWTDEISAERFCDGRWKKGSSLRQRWLNFLKSCLSSRILRRSLASLPHHRVRDAGRADQCEPLCLHDINREGEEILQPRLFYTELGEERHLNRIVADVGGNLQSQISKFPLRWVELTVKTTGTTLPPSFCINMTQAMGMRTSCGKGGVAPAHPEIVAMFRVWSLCWIWCNAIVWFNTII